MWFASSGIIKNEEKEKEKYKLIDKMLKKEKSRSMWSGRLMGSNMDE